jgi:hypothetical protein
MKEILTFIVSRLRERSTWLGLISLATALGILLTPEQQETVIAAGMALGGLVGAFTRDKT